ncbi:MAG: hypothetical protein INR63_16165 [Actinomycetospora chiangmaiensis]|nr:hypothetical protein [Actinomycetospora chiangmaiensis]
MPGAGWKSAAGPALAVYLLLPLLPPLPCGATRDGWPALPAAAESVEIVSAGRPVGETVTAGSLPVEFGCWLTTPGDWAPGATGLSTA